MNFPTTSSSKSCSFFRNIRRHHLNKRVGIGGRNKSVILLIEMKKFALNSEIKKLSLFINNNKIKIVGLKRKLTNLLKYLSQI